MKEKEALTKCKYSEYGGFNVLYSYVKGFGFEHFFLFWTFEHKEELRMYNKKYTVKILTDLFLCMNLNVWFSENSILRNWDEQQHYFLTQISKSQYIFNLKLHFPIDKTILSNLIQ